VSEENFLEQVKRDLSEEKKLMLIKKAVPLFVAAFTLALVVTIAYIWWGSYKLNIAHQDGAKYLMAEVKKRYYDIPNMVKILEEMADEESSYGALSQIFLASEAALRGENNRAQSFLEKTATGGYKSPIKEVGKLELLTLKMSRPEVNLKEVIAELDKLYEGDSIVRYNAGELLVLALKKNNDQRYKEIINKAISAADTPGSIKVRLAGYQD